MSKSLDSAVKAFQLYAGSMACPLKTQQKLYNRAMKKAASIAKAKGIALDTTADQLSSEARRRGIIIPTPGKDY